MQFNGANFCHRQDSYSLCQEHRNKALNPKVDTAGRSGFLQLFIYNQGQKAYWMLSQTMVKNLFKPSSLNGKKSNDELFS